jgi:hypothetical protein
MCSIRTDLLNQENEKIDQKLQNSKIRAFMAVRHVIVTVGVYNDEYNSYIKMLSRRTLALAIDQRFMILYQA